MFIVPAMAYLVCYQVDRHYRWFAVLGWLTMLFTLVSLYPLMALLRHELFPTSTLLVGNPPHVNFIGMVLYNASRGKDGGLFDIHSAFWQMMALWAQDDPTLVIGGSLSALLATLAIRWDRLPAIMGIMTLSLALSWQRWHHCQLLSSPGVAFACTQCRVTPLAPNQKWAYVRWHHGDHDTLSFGSFLEEMAKISAFLFSRPCLGFYSRSHYSFG